MSSRFAGQRISVDVEQPGLVGGCLRLDFAAGHQAVLSERRARIEPEPWVPSEEEKVAIAEGYLKVIAMKGGPTILIDLRAAKESRNCGEYRYGEVDLSRA